jgi:hypothetical protein
MGMYHRQYEDTLSDMEVTAWQGVSQESLVITEGSDL